MLQIFLGFDRLIPELVANFGPPELGRIYGAYQDKVNAIWRFPAYWPFLEKTLSDINSLFGEVSYSDKALKHIQIEQDKAELIEKQGLKEKDKLYFTEPYQHQLEGLSLLANSYRNGLLYDRGLGKTKIAIDTIMIRKKRNPFHKAIVLAPPVTLPSWEKEIAFHSNGTLSSFIYLGVNRDKKLPDDFDILLTTYETAKSSLEKLKKLKFLSIFADESHKLRNLTSGNTKAALKLCADIPYRTIMSGSVALGDPRHLYGQLKFLADFINPENYTKFCNKFLKVSPYNRQIVIGYQRMNTLNKRLLEVSKVRTKDECLDLPERIITDIYIKPENKIINAYNDLVTDYATEIEGESIELADESAIVQIGKLCQITSGFLNKSLADKTICDGCDYLEECVDNSIKPYTRRCRIEKRAAPSKLLSFNETSQKIKQTASLINDILEEKPDNKVIVWANLNHELTLLHQELSNLRNYKIQETETKEEYSEYFEEDDEEEDIYSDEFIFLTGKSNFKKVIEVFNNNADTRVLLGQVKCGIGITLNSAAFMIYMSLPLDLEPYLQSIDRNYRIGQDKSVLVYRMITSQTIEETIASLLDQKENISQILSSPTFCLRCKQSNKCLINPNYPYKKDCGLKSTVTKEKINVKKI